MALAAHEGVSIIVDFEDSRADDCSLMTSYKAEYLPTLGGIQIVTSDFNAGEITSDLLLEYTKNRPFPGILNKITNNSQCR